ncbi:hypothetical protein KO488_06625 [Poseidonibacter lekithochrous]|uniref:hypothetical protein n=1 Tax=Poseidonibacter TaxID=2321187 RepID=UPI001C093C1A|nr:MULTISPECIES: hypothetical protein [Poseidonibacter]MBU3014427.1 hypothetical protein [Poseidonibacter lekithochrous]MDO6827725.1 hypothetical protein [Poseidonibacter sp. 1_MG-2023]
MIKINIEDLEGALNNHVENVQDYINYDALENRERIYIEKNIEYILKAKPDEFEDVIMKARQNNIDNNRLKKAFVGGSKYGGSIGYSKFSSKGTSTYNAYDLAQKLKVNICPYCNRNYTFTIKEKNSKSTRPDFDHFYDKGTYPILALSFYNLIPSCILCNSRLKGRAKFSINTHLHPYKDSFNDYAKFKLKVLDSKFYYDEKSFEIKLETKNNKAKKIKEDFALETLYQEHKDIVLELIQKREVYPDSYIDDLFQQYEGTLFKNREDVLRHITGGYIEDKDIDKRPLSKLIKDISEELDLI